jgi:hypothetical protein
MDEDHLVPKEPKKPVQPANVWRLRDDQLVTLYSVDDHDIHSETGETDFWKRKMLDMDDFHEFRSQLNMSFDGKKSNSAPLVEDENALRRRGSDKKMPLVPKNPFQNQNNKSKNRRTPEKPKP